jgi:hypothetical protein
VNLWYPKPGHKIRTRDGAETEVLAETQDGEWIKVRYLDSKDDPCSLGRRISPTGTRSKPYWAWRTVVLGVKSHDYPAAYPGERRV